MSLAAGARLGPYEIESPLGAGGMGEVYRARDTRLERTVAVKVLPDHFAADAQFRERFEREARVVSSLEHPHICALYDVGDYNGAPFLVMQYLEGETLAARLTRGPLPLSHALDCAIQIAGALHAAHCAGIVHRDLKPGNIFLLGKGASSGPLDARLLDFGLARPGAPVVGGAGLSMLPTSPPALTAHGTILGTFQYMAPEQVEGRVSPLPMTGERWPVSTAGGLQGRWRGDGRELYYLTLEGTVMAVDFGGGSPPQIGTPQRLFETDLQPAYNLDYIEESEDGKRFLIKVPVQRGAQSMLNVIVNWTSLLPN